MRRLKLLQDIYQHAEKIGTNKATLVFLLASLTDKGLTKFHREFLKIKKHKKAKQ